MHLLAALKATDRNVPGLAQVAVVPAERRHGERRSLTLSAVSSSPSAGEYEVIVRDISVGGLLVETKDHVLAVGDLVEVGLPERGAVSAKVVWQSGSFSGCQFEEPVTAAAVSAALLSADPLGQPTNPNPNRERIQRSGGNRTELEPELNFSVAFALALFTWAIIGAAAYYLLR